MIAAPVATSVAAPVAARESIRIPVTGMTCAACQARVQSALAREPGVADASVNLMMESAAVTFANKEYKYKKPYTKKSHPTSVAFAPSSGLEPSRPNGND